MKITKIFAIILAIAIALPLMLTVNAADTTTATIESKSAQAGETFTVSLVLANCPEVNSMGINMDYFSYNKNVLEMISGVWTKSATLKTDWYADKEGDPVWSCDTLTDVNGKVFEMTFKVKDGVANGTTDTISCDIILKNSTTTYPVTVVAGTVIVEEPSSRIDSADMTLDTDITVNYYAELDDSHVGAQMRFTMNGVETIVEGTETETAGIYVYPYRNLAPQCMGDNIKAELVLDGVVLDTKEEYSVKTYCENTLAKTAAQLSMSNEKYAALKTLIADMLEYGAKAQIYKNHNVDALVNEGITGKSDFVAVDSSYEKYIEESGLEGVEMTAVGVYFDYTNSFYLRFTAPDMTEDNFCILVVNDTTGEEVEYTLSDCKLLSEETSTYLLIMDPCAVTGYNDLYYVDLYGPNSKGRVVSQQYLEYSVAAYVYSMQNKTDENGNLTPMAELARATYNYGLSATAYNGIAN